MAKLYRYLEKKYMKTFLDGQIRFRSLAYYRDLEKDGARDDRFEGALVFQPEGGLQGTNVTTGNHIDFGDLALHSRADVDWIYAACFSNVLSEELFRRFKADACVEIIAPDQFISRIRKAIRKLLGTSASKEMIANSVEYYGHDELPKEAWALPKKIIFRKNTSFAWQEEFRIAYPTNGSFEFEGVKLTLEDPRVEKKYSRQPAYGLRVFPVGNLESICKVHEL